MRDVLAIFFAVSLVLAPAAIPQGPDRFGGGRNASEPADAKVQASGTPHFEVASIHASGKDSGTSTGGTADTVIARGQPVFGLILMAYFPLPLWSSDRIRNCNDPVCHQEYDVVAKIAVEDLPRVQGPEGQEVRRKMLQNLLAERFKLRLHTIATELPGFALVINRKGAGLTLTPKDEQVPEHGIRLSHGGIMVRLSNQGDKMWAVYDAPMASFADLLELHAHAVVEDRTGLMGHYDFVLSKNPDASGISHGEPGSPDDFFDLDLLGLHVEPMKAATTTLVIDHVEKPSLN